MFIDTSSVACDSNVTSCAAVAESLLLIDCRPGWRMAGITLTVQNQSIPGRGTIKRGPLDRLRHADMSAVARGRSAFLTVRGTHRSTSSTSVSVPSQLFTSVGHYLADSFRFHRQLTRMLQVLNYVPKLTLQVIKRE